MPSVFLGTKRESSSLFPISLAPCYCARASPLCATWLVKEIWIQWARPQNGMRHSGHVDRKCGTGTHAEWYCIAIGSTTVQYQLQSIEKALHVQLIDHWEVRFGLIFLTNFGLRLFQNGDDQTGPRYQPSAVCDQLGARRSWILMCSPVTGSY